MKVLVTGGTGVIGESTVRALHRRGHRVRVLSRHARRDEKSWPSGVEAWVGDVTNEKSIRGAGENCDVVLHIAGIAEEKPPASTFHAVNVQGARRVLREAERAGVSKIVYVSSLGAERGRSDYHKSKRVAEDAVRSFSRAWTIVRPGAVYGPGDGHISVLLRMVRSLPMIPTVGDGSQAFQPVWHEDVAQALALAVERADVDMRVLEIAGPDVTSQNDLLVRLRALTGRAAVQAPVPELFASLGLMALDALGVEVPFTRQQLEMLADGNVIRAGGTNALTEVFGVSATRLDEGLARLVNEQREQHPSEGVGALTKKRYWVDVRGGRFDADALFLFVRDHLAELMPALVRINRDTSARSRIALGTTLTVEIPVRGQVQVRAVEVADRHMTLLTLAGHPIAGAVRFSATPRDDTVRFEIQVFDRAATVLDQLMLRTVGDFLQHDVWTGLAANVAAAAAGKASDVHSTEQTLDAAELHVVDEWARSLSVQSSRTASPSGNKLPSV